MARIGTLLVDLPFMSAHRPSIALATLKAYLLEKGFPCRMWASTLDFARRIGLGAYRRIADNLPQELLLGDLVFSPLLDPRLDASAGLDDIESRLRSSPEHFGHAAASVVGMLRTLRAHAIEFSQELADRIAAAPERLVGFNLTFQLTPAMGLARLVKDRAPRKLIIVGGGNCDDEMGVAIQEACPWIDFVCRGEGEAALLALVRRLSEGGLALGGSIPGVLERGGGAPPDGTRGAPVDNLDDLPPPAYDDWLEQFDESGLPLPRAELSLPFETSRGCWYGAKHHCTFCGLNGPSLAFRSKSAARAEREIRGLARHGVPRADSVDNILDFHYFQTLLPRLASENHGLSIFFELKANLTAQQVELLGRAGVRSIQAGIESLDTRMLDLMRKGVHAYQNIRLLKWAAQFDVFVAWNILHGFPGEEPVSYARMERLVPALVHLCPPLVGCTRLVLNRFSPLFDRPDALGVRGVRPVPAYRSVFPAPSMPVERLAYFFDFDRADGLDSRDYIDPLARAVDGWRAAVGEAAFCFVDRGDTLGLFDTRPCARSSTTILRGSERDLYLACEAGVTRLALIGTSGLSDVEVSTVVERFLENRWAIDIDGRILAVAVNVTGWIPARVPTALLGAVALLLYRERSRGWKEALDAFRDARDGNLPSAMVPRERPVIEATPR